ncbi:Pkinase domain-containing protein [Cephalotus follicularis]|uniref:Pkinase domain-containing protein n=1 Tax=Cephalotus follicularis TaxID=3775 RepID=A0A1Q3B3J1_CEPFO|nr:Pkinase domain-containing protein [Cephalotus follicularis]
MFIKQTPQTHMCKSRKSMDVIQPNTPKSSKSLSSSPNYNFDTTNSNDFNINNKKKNKKYNNNYYSKSSTSSTTSNSSLSTLKDSLPENPHIYNFSEICAATNNFLAKPISSSSTSSSWRCTLRDKQAIVFKRKLRHPIDSSDLRDRLSLVCRGHHSSLIRLLGASLSGNCIYLVYEYVSGANLADCLRNRMNPNFTVLSSWLSRIKIAADIAHGLDYIHNCSGLDSKFIHNHIKTTSVIVSEDQLHAKICHFGTAELCGESLRFDGPILGKSDSGGIKIEGTRGYMAPEFQGSGIATQKCDVYAFGVVLLELLSGEEGLRYVFDEGGGGYKRVSVIETAREAVSGGVGGVRRWADRRLKDSFPVEVAEKTVIVGLECVEEDPYKRPDMGRVAGMVSRLYLESVNWAERIGVPIDFTVSMAPR